MFEDEAEVELQLFEVDLIRDVLEEKVMEWQRALRESQSGKASLMETIGCHSDLDAEFQLECYRKLSNKLSCTQKHHARNEVHFVDETELFRPEQTVELFQVRQVGVDQMFYVFQSKYGYYLIYESLEALVEAFRVGRESKLRFEAYTEVEFYLAYWRPKR